jgi:ubiquinone biosynthesis monooxygenase Coq7
VSLAPIDPRVVARILRVNHAGEFGAIRIYGAQIAVSDWLRPGASAQLKTLLGHEREHLKRFRAVMDERGVRPCHTLWFWGLGGASLGAVTALLGRNAVFVCTEAVERTMHRHLSEQLAYLGDRDPFLPKVIGDIQVEEEGHLDYAVGAQDVKGAGGRFLARTISLATEILIVSSTYGGSLRMERDLRPRR